MKHYFSYFFVLCLSCFLTNCSDDEPKKDMSIFDFCHFKADAVVSDAESTTIAFFAIPFDEDKTSWKMKIMDKDGNEKESSIQSIERTSLGYSETDSKIMKIEVKTATRLDKGDYTLQIANKNTGQTQLEIFAVVNSVLPIASIPTDLSQYLNLSCGEGSSKFLFAKESDVYLTISNRYNEISGVYFQQKNGNTNIGLDVTKATNNRISFTIPNNIPADDYFMMVEFNNTKSDIVYYPNVVGIMSKKLPVITAVNKTVFTMNETVVLTGENFRFKIDDQFLPNKYIKPETIYGVGFDFLWNNEKSSATYYYWNNDFTINEEGTRIEFPVDNLKTYIVKWDNNADVYVKTYSGYSNKIKITLPE
jgi:hypothetical protein